MAEKFYKKEYIFGENGNLQLLNRGPAEEYIEEMLDKLLSASNIQEESKIKLEILKNFKEIYEYDLINAAIPEPFGYFKDDNTKKEFIAKHLWIQEMALYLGDFFANYHEKRYLKIKIIPGIIIPQTMINYTEMYYKAVCDYYSVILRMNYPYEITKNGLEYRKNINARTSSHLYGENNKHAITATFSLPALIEHFLAHVLQKRMIFDGLEKLNILIEQNKIVLEQEDKDIITEFMKIKTGARIVTFNANEKYITERLYRLFINNNILINSEDNKMILTGKRRTLGALIQSDYTKFKVKEEYMYLLENMFSVKKMNLRNNIMHGSDANFNYFSVIIVSVMLEIFLAIAREEIFI